MTLLVCVAQGAWTVVMGCCVIVGVNWIPWPPLGSLDPFGYSGLSGGQGDRETGDWRPEGAMVGRKYMQKHMFCSIMTSIRHMKHICCFQPWLAENIDKYTRISTTVLNKYR